MILRGFGTERHRNEVVSVLTRSWPWLSGVVVLAACVAVAGADTVAGAYTIPNLYGGKDSTCFWNIGVINPRYINIATQDTDANYWAAAYTLPAGARLQLKGKYPHGRYVSIQSYNLLGQVVDAVSDHQINPDRGSRNPFRPGVRRDVKRRSFTLTLRDSSPPKSMNSAPRANEPARNVLYTKPVGDTTGLHSVMWRVFIPDKGRDLRGGVALPKPVLTLADGTVQTGQRLCNTLTTQVKRIPDPSALLIPASQYNALRYQPGVPPWFPAKNPPAWRVQYNRDYLLALYTGPTYHPVIKNPPKGGQGGFFPNLDVQYVRAAINRKLGKVVAFRGTMPTTPKTFHSETFMRQGTQLRYLSFCLDESVLTTRVMGCAYDEQIPVRAHRRYVVVTSRAADRPRNATKKCGVAWLAWSPRGDGGRDHDFGWMQVRNMLPSPSFHHAIQDTRVPGDQRRVMGRYLPKGRYYKSKRAFEKLGCPVR
jgi:hypothetical protein